MAIFFKEEMLANVEQANGEDGRGKGLPYQEVK